MVAAAFDIIVKCIKFDPTAAARWSSRYRGTVKDVLCINCDFGIPFVISKGLKGLDPNKWIIMCVVQSIVDYKR